MYSLRESTTLPPSWMEFLFPNNLEGKRVLDIGYWNGCFCFEAERRGAQEVVGIGPEAPEATRALKLREILGSQITDFHSVLSMTSIRTK